MNNPPSPFNSLRRDRLKLITCLSALFFGNALLSMNPGPGEQLCKAAEDGNYILVKKLLEEGVFVNSTNIQGSAPLMKAAGFGHTNICELLLDHNAPVDSKTDYFLPPLTCAAIMGHFDTCKFLLDKGADINAQNYTGRSALYTAAEQGFSELCQLLIDNKAEIDIRDNHQETPLMRAVFPYNQKVCEVLLANKANIYLQDREGRDLLGQAFDSSWISNNGNESLSSHTAGDLIIIEHLKIAQKKAVIFLGVKKLRQAAFLNLLDKNIIRLVARQIHTL